MRRRGGVWPYLVALGPGLLAANAGNDAGGIATYATAGASYGYEMLWAMAIVTVCVGVVQEMSARMGAVTGKGFSDLVRESFTLRTSAVILLTLLVANAGIIVSEFIGIAAAAELFGVSRYIAVPLAAVLVWLLVTRGSYGWVERVFLVLSLAFLAYVGSAFLARPDWNAVLHSTVRPQPRLEMGYLQLLIALIGTTISPYMQLYVQSSVVEKGVTPGEYRYTRFDVIAGTLFAGLVAGFIIIATAATLHPRGIEIGTAADAAMALEPIAGHFAGELFALGLLGASLLAAGVLPLATTYMMSEALGFERGVSRTWSEAPIFMGMFTEPDRAGSDPGADPRPAADQGPGRGLRAERSAAAHRAVRHPAPGQQPRADGKARQRPLPQRLRLDHRHRRQPALAVADRHDRPWLVRRGLGPLTPLKSPLPIDEVLPELVSALRGGNAAVLIAPTGAGKTTRVPPALLAAGIAGERRIVMLEPRRIAARAAARRMAEEGGWRLGEEVGYQVRFERRAGPSTRILVVTEGILVQMLQADPFLEDIGAVLFDEIHERSLHTDLSLAMARRVQREVRPDLRLVAMSATLDPGPIAAVSGGTGDREPGTPPSRRDPPWRIGPRTGSRRLRSLVPRAGFWRPPRATSWSSCPASARSSAPPRRSLPWPRSAASPSCRSMAICRPSSRTRRCGL